MTRKRLCYVASLCSLTALLITCPPPAQAAIGDGPIYFTIGTIDEPGETGHVRYVLLNPFPALAVNRPFWLSGVDYVDPLIYWNANDRSGSGGRWGPHYTVQAEWAFDLVEDLTNRNINMIGAFSKIEFTEEPFCPEFGETECAAPLTTENYWQSTKIYDYFNNLVESSVFVGEYPAVSHLPFTTILSIIPTPGWTAGVPACDYLPDVWSDSFLDLAVLRAFLALSDGSECYEAVARPVFSKDEGGNDIVCLPLEWQQHQPKGLRNRRELVGVYLGNDYYWPAKIDESPEAGSYERRLWIRKIVAQSDSPGKRAFMEAMQAKYQEHFAPPADIAAWNATYESKGYRIDHWWELLNFSATPNCDAEIDVFFPLDEGPGERDLGAELIEEDAEYFQTKLAAQFYAVAVKAVRAFDPNHLIFTDRRPWKVNDHPTTDPLLDDVNILLEAAKAGVQAVGQQNYTGYIGADHQYGGDIENNLDLFERLAEENWPIPFIVAEFTVHADFEYGWDKGWNEPPEYMPCDPDNGWCGYDYTETRNKDDQGPDYEAFAIEAYKGCRTINEVVTHPIMGTTWYSLYHHQYHENSQPRDPENGPSMTQSWGLYVPKDGPRSEDVQNMRLLNHVDQVNCMIQSRLTEKAECWNGIDSCTDFSPLEH